MQRPDLLGILTSFRAKRWILVFAGATVVAAGAACARAADASKSEIITSEFALYFSPKPSADPENELSRLLADHTRRLDLVGAEKTSDAVATVSPHWVSISKYTPPTAQSLRYTGEGVLPAEAPALAAADRVFVLEFATPRHGVLPTNHSVCILLADLAQATGGRIWDEETRQLYSLERWRTRRVDTWQRNLPDMRSQVTMHAYADPDLVRIITLGMRKFGLPDLVVAEIPSQQTRPVGNFINAVMQRLVEGQRPEQLKMQLTLAEIRHEAARTSALDHPAKGAKGTAMVSIREVTPEKGDPDNTLWLLDFPEAKLAGVTERALWGADQLYGSTDKITGAKHDDPEMSAARDRARKAFFAQEAHFRAGLAFNEHLLVKAPFSEGDQTEYMWVEVVKWGAKDLDGILANDPFYVKKLHDGSRVTVRLDDIYDYLLHKPDGTEEGNESGKVLERREKQ